MQYQTVTDGQTDRQTDRQTEDTLPVASTRYSTASVAHKSDISDR